MSEASSAGLVGRLRGALARGAGVCLFESEPVTFAAYRANAISEWLDFEETIAPHRERFLPRLAGGPP